MTGTARRRLARLRIQGAAAARHISERGGSAGARPDPAATAVSIVMLTAAAGTLLVALGDTVARLGGAAGETLVWAGIVLIVLPISVRLLARDATRGERIVLVVILSLATFVVKVLHGPAGFVLYDELLHVRTATDMAETGSLLAPNPLLPISPAYPGLELVTNLIASVAGVPVFEAGLVVVGLARVLLAIALFALLEDASGSPRAAGLGAVVYASNPSFVFFNSQFAYESLALPLAIMAMWAGMRWQRSGSKVLGTLAACAVLGTVVTHHLTSGVLVAFLAAWTFTTAVVDRATWRIPAALLALSGVASVVWLLLVAPATAAYLEPRVASVFELVRLILGEAEIRALFTTTQGTPSPLWEQTVVVVSVALTVLVIPFGLWQTWRHRRWHPGALALALGALGWPASLGLRLTPVGADEATRVPEFVFVGVALLAGMAVASIRLPRPAPWPALARVAFGGTAAVIAAGGLVLGVPAWNRVPGPYQPSADSRSIDPEGLAAAAWVAEHQPPGVRLVSDRVNRALIGSASTAYPVTAYGDGIATALLFLPPRTAERSTRLIREGQVALLVGDLRLTTAAPLTRVYYESGEPETGRRRVPLDRDAFDSWDRVLHVSRIYDSGAIRMWNVERIRDGG